MKFGGLKKKSATPPWPHLNLQAQMRVCLGSNHSQSLMASNFAALWPTDSKFSALKDLNLFEIVSIVQEASRILRVVFALSKWPHLHKAYAVTVPFILILALWTCHIWDFYSTLWFSFCNAYTANHFSKSPICVIPQSKCILSVLTCSLQKEKKREKL